MATVVEGSLRVRWALRKFRQSTQTRITKAAQRTALSGLAKDIKAQIPGRHKDARKAVGSSLKKSRKTALVEGKAGIGVGKKKKKQVQDEQAAKRGRPGVGITANNIHWMILGTKERYTKKGKQYRGIMRPNDELKDLIVRSWRLGRIKFMATMEKRMRQLIEREAAKLAAKDGKKWSAG